MKYKKMATAIQYKAGEDRAPKVIAKGYGTVADNILKKAEAHDIPVYKDEKLARQLETLQLGQEVPPDLYEAIAEVLVFISRLDQHHKQKKG